MGASQRSRRAVSFAGDTCASMRLDAEREAIVVVNRQRPPWRQVPREEHCGTGPLQAAGADTAYSGVMFDACRPFGPRFTS